MEQMDAIHSAKTLSDNHPSEWVCLCVTAPAFVYRNAKSWGKVPFLITLMHLSWRAMLKTKAQMLLSYAFTLWGTVPTPVRHRNR